MRHVMALHISEAVLVFAIALFYTILPKVCLLGSALSSPPVSFASQETKDHGTKLEVAFAGRKPRKITRAGTALNYSSKAFRRSFISSISCKS
jgi:hypothetical protein